MSARGVYGVCMLRGVGTNLIDQIGSRVKGGRVWIFGMFGMLGCWWLLVVVKSECEEDD